MPQKTLSFIFLMAIFSLAFISSGQETTPEATQSFSSLGGGRGDILFMHPVEDGLVPRLMDVNGENIRTIPNFEDYVAHYRWSPDGEEIAYVAQGTSGAEIFVFNLDSTDRRQLSDNNTRELLPVWSPDGEEIVFASTRAGNVQLFIMNAGDGSDVRQLTSDVAAYSPHDWHPSGDWIAATKVIGPNAEIVLISPETGEELLFTQWDSTDTLPRFSPDGTRLAWVSNREGYSEIFMVDFEESLEQLPLGEDRDFIEQLTFPSNGWIGHGHFSWSPDGQYIASSVLTDDKEPFQSSGQDYVEVNIHLINVETGEVNILTYNDKSSTPEWRP